MPPLIPGQRQPVDEWAGGRVRPPDPGMRQATCLPTFGSDPKPGARNQEERRMIDLITKAYVLKNFAADAIDFVKDRMDDMDIDLDTERMLNKVGLARRRPMVGAF